MCTVVRDRRIFEGRCRRQGDSFQSRRDRRQTSRNVQSQLKMTMTLAGTKVVQDVEVGTAERETGLVDRSSKYCLRRELAYK